MSTAAVRRRARDLGLAPGHGATGPTNSIVDVPGVRVGQTTVVEDPDVRTGVTAVVPDAVDVAGGRLPAGLFVGNGYGKLIGATQLVELGEIETPVVLTGTLSAFRVADALVSYVLELPGNEALRTLNPVVGETNDGYLSDIRRRPVSADHVLHALRSATSEHVEQGCVGAGTGTAALGYKGGIGSSSRSVSLRDGVACTVGVIAQTNFSGTLTVRGMPIPPPAADEPPAEQGDSCMLIVAVDAGLDSRQLTRVAHRAVLALGDVGSDFAQGSGDYAIAFDTATDVPATARLTDAELDPLFRAARDAAAEAMLDSLFLATTTVGIDGHVRTAVPLDDVAHIVLRRHRQTRR